MKKMIARIAACSLAVLIAFNTVAIPKSKAVALGSQFASAVTAAFMTATGFSMSANGDWSGSSADMYIADRLDGFLRDFAEARDMTKAQFEEVIYDGVEIVHGGLVKISSGVAALLGGFSDWLIDKLGLVSGGEFVPVYTSSSDGFICFDAAGNTYDIKFGQVVYTTDKPYVIPGTCSSSEWPLELYLQHDGTYIRRVEMGSFSGGVPSGQFLNFYWIDSASQQTLHYLCQLQKHHIIHDDVNQQWIFADLVQDDTGYWRIEDSAKYYPFAEYPWIDEFFNVSIGDVSIGLDANYEAPPVVEDQYSMVIDTGMTFSDEQACIDAVLGGVASGSFAPTYTIEIATGGDVVLPDEDADTQAGILGWVKTIAQRVASLPRSIAEAVESIFVPDVALTTEITDTFSEKFAFVPQIHALGADLLNLGPDSGPPVIYIHLEDAEGAIDYGGTVKALDMSWYERYKEDGDRIIGGFLWLGFLWALFMRVSDIINGAGMAYVLGQPTIYTPEPPNDAPRLEGSRKRGKR